MMPIFKKSFVNTYEFKQILEEYAEYFGVMISHLDGLKTEVNKLSTRNQQLTNRIEDLINKLEVIPKTTSTYSAPPKKPTEADERF